MREILLLVLVIVLAIGITAYFVNRHFSHKKCPNNCSGHGTCNRGNCSCDNNWGGNDCSRPANQTPMKTASSPALEKIAEAIAEARQSEAYMKATYVPGTPNLDTRQPDALINMAPSIYPPIQVPEITKGNFPGIYKDLYLALTPGITYDHDNSY